MPASSTSHCPALLGSTLALGLALAGCTLDPRVPDVPVTLPASYGEAIGVATSEPGWWAAFGSTELDTLLARARAGNLDIAAAVARIRQADAQVRVSLGPLIPSVDLDGQASRSWQNGSGSSGSFTDPTTGGSVSFGSGGSGVSKRYEASLNASYELDFWGRNRSALRSAEAGAAANRYDAVNITLQTEASVAGTYFQYVTFARRAEIARANLETAGRILEAVRARLRFGTASALDEAQQESLYAQIEATIPPLLQQQAQAGHALAILVGVPPEASTLVGSDPSALATPPVDPGLPIALLQRRPDIALQEALLAGARFDVQSARAALFPSIQLTGQGGFQSTALRSLLDPAGTFYQIAAGLTQPLLQLYPLQGQVELQRARYVELMRDYQRTVLVALQDVDDALVAYARTTEQEALQQRAVDVAARAFRIAEAQLREGIIDLTTLLDTQQTLFSTQDTLAQVRLTRLQALVDLFQALGGGWQRPDTAGPAGLPAGVIRASSAPTSPSAADMPMGEAR